MSVGQVSGVGVVGPRRGVASFAPTARTEPQDERVESSHPAVAAAAPKASRFSVATLRRYAATAMMVAVSAACLPAMCEAQAVVPAPQVSLAPAPCVKTETTSCPAAPTAATGDDAEPDPHARDIGRFHAAGDVDDFHAQHSQGIDGGDWPADHDNLNGAYLRAELKRNYRVDGQVFSTGDADKPGNFAGVEFGSLGARSETTFFLTAPFGKLGSPNGVAGSFDTENTIGLSAARADAHRTFSLDDGHTTVQVGARGFLGGTAGLELSGTLSQRPTSDQPNGFDFEPHHGIGGRVESYASVKHDLGTGSLTAEVHTGTEYNLIGQTYGNHDDQRSAFYVMSQQGYQLGSGPLKGVELDLREDFHPTEPWSRVAAQVQKDVRIHGVAATVGVFAGEEVEHGQHTPMAGIGINFHL